MTEDATDAAGTLVGLAVVLDTNHLDQTGLLKDPLTIAMLFYLGQLQGQLVLPAVVKGEWLEHWVAHVRKQYKTFSSTGAWLSGHVDGVPSFEIDIESAAQKALTARLDELGDLLVEEPTGEDDWRGAGEMVLAKRPPTTEGSQQFKDSLLWQALLRIGQHQKVLLVSSDKGFVAALGEGLEPSLAAEAEELRADIELVRSRQDLLDLMKANAKDFTVNLEGMWAAIEDPFVTAVDEVLYEQGMEVGADVGWGTDVFATGDPRTVAVSIEMRAQLDDLSDPTADMPWYVSATGSALMNVETWELDVSLEAVTFTAATAHGDVDRDLLSSGPVRHMPRSKLDIAFMNF